MQHQIVYDNPGSYCAFPDIKRLRNGQIVVVFREADRRRFATHLDRTSRLVMLRSNDEGQSWVNKTIIYDEAEASLQDPSIRQLADGRLVVSFFKWAFGAEDDAPDLHLAVRPLDEANAAWLVGVFVTTSADNGVTWSRPIRVSDPWINNRDAVIATSDAVIETCNGELLLPIEAMRRGCAEGAGIMRSADGGSAWSGFQDVGYDPLGQIGFYEPALIKLRSGKLICMMRTHLQGLATSESASFLYQSDSSDDGHTWTPPVRTPLWGHPAQLCQLHDGRIICSYGYRRPPFGIRAAISRDDGQTWDIEHEVILRADGRSDDLGYPTTAELENGRVLTTYYMHHPHTDWRLGHAIIASTMWSPGHLHP